MVQKIALDLDGKDLYIVTEAIPIPTTATRGFTPLPDRESALQGAKAPCCTGALTARNRFALILAATNDKIREIIMRRTIFCLFVLGLTASQAHADHITVSGNVSGVWDVDTVLVVGDITVPAGQSLTIQPGVKVLFGGYFLMNVQTAGLITASGTQVDSIYFAPMATMLIWPGINLNEASDSSRFEYCVFTSGTNALNLNSSNIRIDHCQFEGGFSSSFEGGAVVCVNDADCQIMNSTFQNNNGSYGVAIYCDESAPLIIGNLFSGNHSTNDYGVLYSHGHSGGVISNNVFIDNTTHGIHVNGDYPYNDSTYLAITNNVFFRNHAQSGGGMSIKHKRSVDIISNCIVNNSASVFQGGGGGIFSYSSSPLIKGNVISYNTAMIVVGGGGGLQCWSSGNPVIEFNTFHANTSTGYGGGGIYCTEGADALIRFNLFAGNFASNGGGYRGYGSNPVISKNTFFNNTVNWNGGTISVGAYYPNYTTTEISNSLMWKSTTPIIYTTIQNLFITYSDIQDTLWPGLGNLSSDPRFIDPEHHDYRVRWNSPCIDAGHPDSLDPDGTRSDMGAFYYDQSYPVHVYLTPRQIPYLIHAEGGSLTYTLRLSNHDPSPNTAQVWCNVTLPDSTVTGPLLGPVTVTVPASTMLARVRTQAVPASAPLGVYHYNAYAVVGSDTSQDSFMFGKLGMVGRWSQVAGGWSNTGEDFGELEKPIITPNSALITSSHPNPFNASTTLSFELPIASLVSLKVYDPSGRLVVNLVEGRHDAGSHEVTFDGAELASGVYLVRLKAGESSTVQKLVLLK
jgi:predicted outer membrane repeat protein